MIEIDDESYKSTRFPNEYMVMKAWKQVEGRVYLLKLALKKSMVENV
jgi:hypothetical protein